MGLQIGKLLSACLGKNTRDSDPIKTALEGDLKNWRKEDTGRDCSIVQARILAGL